jgi:hypothetical protein
MAIESGLGWTTFSVDNAAGALKALKDDTFALNFATPRGVWDITTLGMSAYARTYLLADFTCEPSGGFDDTADHAFAVLSSASSSNTVRTCTLTVSGQILTNEVLVTDFQQQRPQSGELTWAAPMVLADGTVPTWTT